MTLHIDGSKILDNLDGRRLPWLAEKTGLRYITLWRIATNKQEASANQMLAIGAALGKPVEAFATQQPTQA